MSVSRRLRYEVLRRDDHACRYCGKRAPATELTVDHVVPVALGGTDEPENLVAACRDCNAGKSSVAPDSPIVEAVSDDALRWAAAMRKAAELQQQRSGKRREYIRCFDEHWRTWTIGDEEVERDGNWRTTIGRFHDIGLPGDVLADIIDDVMPRRVPKYRMWRYFCGAVWNVVRQQQDVAQSIIEREELGE